MGFRREPTLGSEVELPRQSEALVAAAGDNDLVSIVEAEWKLEKHSCHILESDGLNLLVTNNVDPPQWIERHPAAILKWLGY